MLSDESSANVPYIYCSLFFSIVASISFYIDGSCCFADTLNPFIYELKRIYAADGYSLRISLP